MDGYERGLVGAIGCVCDGVGLAQIRAHVLGEGEKNPWVGMEVRPVDMKRVGAFLLFCSRVVFGVNLGVEEQVEVLKMTRGLGPLGNRLLDGGALEYGVEVQRAVLGAGLVHLLIKKAVDGGWIDPRRDLPDWYAEEWGKLLALLGVRSSGMDLAV